MAETDGIVKDIQHNDVVLTKMRKFTTHPGNIIYEELLVEQVNEFPLQQSGVDYEEAASIVVDKVLNDKSGRFLQPMAETQIETEHPCFCLTMTREVAILRAKEELRKLHMKTILKRTNILQEENLTTPAGDDSSKVSSESAAAAAAPPESSTSNLSMNNKNTFSAQIKAIPSSEERALLIKPTIESAGMQIIVPPRKEKSIDPSLVMLNMKQSEQLEVPPASPPSAKLVGKQQNEPSGGSLPPLKKSPAVPTASLKQQQVPDPIGKISDLTMKMHQRVIAKMGKTTSPTKSSPVAASQPQVSNFQSSKERSAPAKNNDAIPVAAASELASSERGHAPEGSKAFAKCAATKNSVNPSLGTNQTILQHQHQSPRPPSTGTASQQQQRPISKPQPTAVPGSVKPAQGAPTILPQQQNLQRTQAAAAATAAISQPRGIQTIQQQPHFPGPQPVMDQPTGPPIRVLHPQFIPRPHQPYHYYAMPPHMQYPPRHVVPNGSHQVGQRLPILPNTEQAQRKPPPMHNVPKTLPPAGTVAANGNVKHFQQVDNRDRNVPRQVRAAYVREQANQRKLVTSKNHIQGAIPRDASCVFHVFDRRINFDSFPADASLYSLLRSWVQDDPYRQIPLPGSNVLLDYRTETNPVSCVEQKSTTSGVGDDENTGGDIPPTITCDVLSHIARSSKTQDSSQEDPPSSVVSLRKDLVRRGRSAKRRRKLEVQTRDTISLHRLKRRGICLPTSTT